MKKLIMALVVSLVPLFIMAQDTPLSGLYDKYVSKSQYSAKEILPSAMNTKWEKDISGEAIKKVIDEVNSIRILSTDKGRHPQKSLWKSISKSISEADYTQVLDVNSNKESIRIYYLKGMDGNMKEFALTMNKPSKVMLITVTGDMDMSTLFSKDLMQELKTLGENFKGKVCDKTF